MGADGQRNTKMIECVGDECIEKTFVNGKQTNMRKIDNNKKQDCSPCGVGATANKKMGNSQP